MINYRNIFNPDYNYIGLILIIFLIILIFWNNRNIKQSFQQIGTIITISGFTTLIIAIFLNVIVDLVLPQQFQLFVKVISNNVSQNCWRTSLIAIFSGGTLLIINKLFFKNLKKAI